MPVCVLWRKQPTFAAVFNQFTTYKVADHFKWSVLMVTPNGHYEDLSPAMKCLMREGAIVEVMTCVLLELNVLFM